MKERPILFSTPMVKALLAGTKTQTRRIVKLPADHPELYVDEGGTEVFGPGPYLKFPATDTQVGHGRLRCPYGYPGDRLWVRETWGLHAFGDETGWERDSVAGCSAEEILSQYTLTRRADWGPLQEGCFWRPAIHMPRWASRILLEITEVRVQRLHEITEEDARAEGVTMDCDGRWWLGVEHPIKGTPKVYPTARQAFESLWESINGERRRIEEDIETGEMRAVIDTSARWSANPWVWSLTFKRVEQSA